MSNRIGNKQTIFTWLIAPYESGICCIFIDTLNPNLIMRNRSRIIENNLELEVWPAFTAVSYTHLTLPTKRIV